MISVCEHPIMGGLFGDEEISALWSPESQLRHFRAFEVALALALESTGRISEGSGVAAASVIKTAKLDIAGLNHQTGIDGLPVPEFVRQLRAAAGCAGEAVHTGATSQDVMDTALALTLRDLTDIFLTRLTCFCAALEDLKQTMAHAA